MRDDKQIMIDEMADKEFHPGSVHKEHFIDGINAALSKPELLKLAGYSAIETWISVKDRTPEMIKGENYSENVWGLINNNLYILCYCYIPGEDGGFVWANCDGKIDGDAEFDDEYEPTHWQPFPKPIK